MSTIDRQTVQKMADLGRIALPEEELEQATQKIEQILQFFSAIQAIDTSKAQPADNVTGATNVWRSDEAIPHTLCTPKELIERAPEHDGDYIKVHAVL